MSRMAATNEPIIADTIGRAPDRGANLGAWQFARWRQFSGDGVRAARRNEPDRP